MLLVHQVLNVPSPQNWLMKDEGWIRLSSRFIAEMEPYLKEVHGNEIADCKLCKKTVIRVSLSAIIYIRNGLMSLDLVAYQKNHFLLSVN